ncbi:transcriptional regulator, AraC family [Novosphingobium aromaticivorans DSM 12444]|uniref:Transcriptional regulator, AraC family n=1 Tax=Novosphingobium aromaticivorans (strain ATCC 700278 / DSM 12444 / CCUG 56034 / CIP 105152 / NBRC 16084 / F199) TaxID=279238 RepID=Q2G537_NOVAD|nr:AraC family transcriptional regulator [Novosphingobium aromaticivorans]ABD27036.1 transcriptional regulator, AraC family [Novosphingobium aromaticivorans DSM 12444]SCY48621.1 transcriptional regulator, AraC family [Novosphingobium aromaticivorans]
MTAPTISAPFLRHVANCVELTGRSAAPLLEELGIAQERLDDPEGLIPLAAFLAFFESAATLVRNPHFGLHAGRLAGSDSLGPLSFLFLSAPDLGAAFTSFTRYLALMQQASRNTFTIGDRWATFEYMVQDQRLTARRQDAEYSIGAMFSLARQFTGGTIEFREVRFEHERVGDYARYADFFGCDVFFEQETNALSFDRGCLEIRGKVLSPSLHPIIEDHLRRRESPAAAAMASFADRVRTIVAATPLDRHLPASDAARRLGCSLQTFHRRLAQEGANWRTLVAEHRMEAAARLLRDSRREISAIALALGYSESAAFVRSFSRHFGQSPGRYRRHLQNGAALPVGEDGASSG